VIEGVGSAVTAEAAPLKPDDIVLPHVVPSPRRGGAASADSPMPALVVVANRLPVELVGEGSGAQWTRSPGGLVTALEPVLAERESLWVGWSGVAAEFVADTPSPPTANGSCTLVQIPLTQAQVRQYYEGFCNTTLWPLRPSPPSTTGSSTRRTGR
jgi:hypothetical protein